MKLLRSFPVLAYGLVLLSIAAVCAAQRNIGLLIVAGVLATISWYVTEGPRGRTLPRWVSNVLVIGFTLWVFADLVQRHGDFIKALGQYAVLLTLVKLYERRTARDYAHMLVLSLLLMLTACLQSSDLLFGLMLVAYVLVGLYVLLLYQLYATYERERTDRQRSVPPDYWLVPPLKPVTGRNDVLGFRVQMLAVGTMAAAVSALVFVAFPRGLGANMLGHIDTPMRSRTSGFSWTVDLNAGGRVNDSRALVMNVQLTDASGNAVELPGPMYLRGAVLDVYQTRGSWISSTSERSGHRMYMVHEQPTTLGRETTEPVPRPGQNALTQRIVLSRPIQGVSPIFSMYAPVEVSARAPVAVIYDHFAQTIRTDERSRRLYDYSVVALPEPSDEALDSIASRVRPRVIPVWFTDAQKHRTMLEIANAQLQKAGVPLDPPGGQELWIWNRQVAAALQSYLHSPEFSYTTDLSGVVYQSPTDDPIIRFLKHTKRGHCEFFASALATLCHVKGIPSRVVVGYIAYDYDPAGRQYNVVESNAHAWVEVATGPRRWQTFDPTPPAILEMLHRSSPTLTEQFRWAYQRMESSWTSSIVDFNADAQGDLARRLNQTWSGRVSAAVRRLSDWAERINNFFNVGPGGYIWMGTVALALIIAVIALVKLMRRTLLIRRTLQLRHVRGREYQRMLRHLGFYLDMLDVLAKRGAAKPQWQPPLQFAHALSTYDPEAGKLVQRLTHLFYQGRYGGMHLTPQQLKEARGLIQQLDATCGRHLEPRKRIIG